VVYRPEIDGLRAFAVVPVILFHAGFAAFSGGFVGVDVFFVISGYLITTFIQSDLEGGTWSLARFYERRARRILPALFLVTFLCMPLAWFLLGPEDLRDFAKSLAAVGTFSSNFLFWKQSGYFETEAELKPLLHTWSLAVEEQYYVGFPLLMMALWRFGYRNVVAVLLVVTAGSLAYSQWRVSAGSTGAFFLLPGRSWELAVGALLALNGTIIDRSFLGGSVRWRNALSALGLLLLLFPIFAFDKATSFPGINALPPTVGAGLIIAFANPATAVGRILGSKPALAIGLVSYSAYLWHQPLLAFARYRSLEAPSATLLAAICVVTFLLAYLSWRYVEAPFRDRRRMGGRPIAALGVVGTVMLVFAGISPAFSTGFGERHNEQVKRVIEANPPEPEELPCVPTDRLGRKHAGVACVYGNPARITAAVVGDSHTGPFMKGLHQGFKEMDQGFIHLMHTACPPVLDVYRPGLSAEGGCPEFNAAAHEFLLRAPDVGSIILIARWSYYLDGHPYDNGEGGVEAGSKVIFEVAEKGEKTKSSPERRRAALLRKYPAMIQEYLDAGKKVILVYPIPEMGWDVPRRVIRQAMRSTGGAEDLSLSYETYLKRNAEVIAAFDALGQRTGLTRIRPDRRLCNQHLAGRCLAQRDGTMLYIDDDHLSQAGARGLVQDILKAAK
jgi:peptidoglycan/LPS O-acetylase OafA/YrhL